MRKLMESLGCVARMSSSIPASTTVLEPRRVRTGNAMEYRRSGHRGRGGGWMHAQPPMSSFADAPGGRGKQNWPMRVNVQQEGWHRAVGQRRASRGRGSPRFAVAVGRIPRSCCQPRCGAPSASSGSTSFEGSPPLQRWLPSSRSSVSSVRSPSQPHISPVKAAILEQVQPGNAGRRRPPPSRPPRLVRGAAGAPVECHALPPSKASRSASRYSRSE